MNRLKIVLLGLLLTLVCVFNSNAQIATGNLFLQGKYLEIGAQANASLGSGIAALPGYHPRTGGTVFLCGGSSSTLLASVYDFGLDGWTVGTPNYMGDYTLPGSPWEGWGIEVNGTREWAYSTNCNLSGGLGAAIGSFTSYTNTGGQAKGIWSGTFLSGQLQIEKEYRIDTLSSAFIVTVKLKNTGATPLNNVYYMRSCDPDQSVPWGGSFTTANTIRFQNDFYHRVMVSATATGGASSTGTPPAAISLGTKDNRAKCLIYNSWPLPTGTSYAAMWAGTVTGLGTTYYAVNSGTSSDIAIGLVFNLCNIAPADSTVFSYAYIYDGATSGMTAALDSAFPEPQLLVNGVVMDSVDTVTTCIAASGVASLNINHGSDKSWSWSSWTWSPGTGLATTTGVNNSITMSSVTAVTTYTIVGSDTTHCRQLSKTFLLTVIPIVSASPIARDTVYCQNDLAAPLSAGVVGIGTLKWYTTAVGGTGTTTAPTPSTISAGSTTWWVTQTISGCESARVPITVVVNPTYTSILPVSICPGASYTFNGTTYTTPGIHPVMFSTVKGCDSLININITILPENRITVIDSICDGDTIQFAGNVYTDSGTYSTTFTNIYGCDSVMTLQLKVILIPSAKIAIYPRTNLCQGDTIGILATTQKNNVLLYYWNFPGTNLVSSAAPEGIYTVTYPNIGIYPIKLVVKNTMCYSDTITRMIDVQKYPDARIAPFEDNVCFDDSLEFKPLNPKQDVIYRWLPIHYFPGQNYVSQTYITGIIDSQRTVILYTMSTHGCVTIDSVEVHPHSCCEFTIPNAFTPNGDGSNDIFRPLGARFKVHEFSIYNRWGVQIYSTKLLINKGWDGTWKDIPQEIGVYFWYIDYECEGITHKQKGDVTLIR